MMFMLNWDFYMQHPGLELGYALGRNTATPVFRADEPK